MEKTVITVVGNDRVGIIANVCTYLAENDINILNITQTIIDGLFNMMMIVDISGSPKKFGEIRGGLEELGDSMGLMIRAQKEEIFNMMHRI